MLFEHRNMDENHFQVMINRFYLFKNHFFILDIDQQIY